MARRRQSSSGLSLIELLCVLGIVGILAGLLLGPVSRVMKRARALRWAETCERELPRVTDHLRAYTTGHPDHPALSLADLARMDLLPPAAEAFLRDPRAQYFPYAAGDPPDKVVVEVRIDPGFLTEAGRRRVTRTDLDPQP